MTVHSAGIGSLADTIIDPKLCQKFPGLLRRQLAKNPWQATPATSPALADAKTALLAAQNLYSLIAIAFTGISLGELACACGSNRAEVLAISRTPHKRDKDGTATGAKN